MIGAEPTAANPSPGAATPEGGLAKEGFIEQVEKVRSEAQMQMLSFPNLEYFLQGQVHILLRGPTMQLRGVFP